MKSKLCAVILILISLPSFADSINCGELGPALALELGVYHQGVDVTLTEMCQKGVSFRHKRASESKVNNYLNDNILSNDDIDDSLKKPMGLALVIGYRGYLDKTKVE